MNRTWKAHLGAGALLLLALQAAAQQPAYRCGARSYSDVACTGGRQVGKASPRVTSKAVPPPQDRATRARRAQLTPERRAECAGLDVTLKEQSSALKAIGATATAADEKDWLQSKQRFRQLHC